MRSGFVDEVERIELLAVYRGGGQVAAVDDHPGAGYCRRVPCLHPCRYPLELQPFPYTDEEWTSSALFDLGTMQDFPQQHQEILYQPLSSL